MKFSSVLLTLLFLLGTSQVFAEKVKVSTWKCMAWEKVDTYVEKVKENAPLKQKAYKPKPIKQKIPDIEPQKGLAAEKKNTIFLEPLFYIMYEKGVHRSVVAPGFGISYVRDLTPLFSLGFGASYAHAFYGKFPNRTFNMYGGKIMLGFKF
ncbi:MAG TPA: hypothetical protein PKL44_00565 [Candidatus Dojkabacteria bacterium]|nr:hypothetical protein [Candidatus Dojkabacteria bacterium]